MNPADLTLSVSSPTLASRTLATPQSTVAALKNGRVVVPRVHLEPIYTTLKTALGDQWVGYKAAVNAFVLGRLGFFPLIRLRREVGGRSLEGGH